MFGRNKVLAEISERLHWLHMALTIRDPGTAKSVEAYDGLRKTLIEANTMTKIYLASLAGLDAAAVSTEDISIVRDKLAETLDTMGIIKIDSIETAARLGIAETDAVNLFDLTGGNGPVLVVDRPAYLMIRDGESRAISRGSAHLESPKVADLGQDAIEIEVSPEEGLSEMTETSTVEGASNGNEDYAADEGDAK